MSGFATGQKATHIMLSDPIQNHGPVSGLGSDRAQSGDSGCVPDSLQRF